MALQAIGGRSMNDKEEEQGSDRFALAAAVPRIPVVGIGASAGGNQGVAEVL